MTTNGDVVDIDIPHLVSTLLGRIQPGAVRDAWWRNEYAFRLQTFASALPESTPDDVDYSTLTKVFRHPAVGSIARSEVAASSMSWAPVCAALRICAAHEYADATAELCGAELWANSSVHLPGTGLVCETATGSLRSLDVIGGLEVNNADQALNIWSDHVDAHVTSLWRTVVSDALGFITDLGNPDFINVASLTTVLVPLLQRDGSDFGRDSRYEIESGSVTDAVGAAFISPGIGDPACFAEALVHESYHNLFNMALEIGDFEKENAEEFYSPWKGATRPTRAVLHGIVAFSAVMRFWRQVSERQVEWATFADELVARRAEEVFESATAVLSAGVLTELGTALAEAAASDARSAL
ncbi:HEXXH motif-containing putative peptide modification protein [Nocardia sp. NPDC052001]|uniref:aKG-HExxH-type peptide beta-hydroxylase n=1 Tax=Nocardia sp. NPDC052001 TaxID=3154853 RepID=UPI003429C3B8